jgi:hypothetical protein
MFEKRRRALGIADVWTSLHSKMLSLKTAEDYIRFLFTAISDSMERK